jgi:F-type H+-transporting ATPase subunit gamma
MPNTQELTRRIKSVKGTRKVTRAMQMVSAAKMRKAQNATMASRGYANLAWQLIFGLPKNQEFKHPLLETHDKATKIGVVLISTNRGLVGSLNSNLLGLIRKLEKEEPNLSLEFIVLGKKAVDGTKRLNKTIVAEFPKSDSIIDMAEVYPMTRLLSHHYASGQYKKILLVYNQFVSTLVQKPISKVILPLIAETPTKQDQTPTDYSYEPNPEQIFLHLLPRILESQLYQAILESNASEHSARMVMMKNATESAGDIIDDLTLTFNQLRQTKITTELSEITAGKIALENK